ncbi:40S ribosomal protein S3-3-like [Iris pallida]|uniref:40S ribosomal protein S3-3-like n=1 Tax=Iris pallida TaxID=29817 RepID=A0AAX6F6L9_IRIPA|nr:40S ribosomal protein S3-3-like [Iris pallida]
MFFKAGGSWHQCEDYVGLGTKRQARPRYPLPDLVTIHMPKDEEEYLSPPVLAADLDIPGSQLLQSGISLLVLFASIIFV